MGYASRVMRGLIISYVRNRQAQKRGGRFELTAIGDGVAGTTPGGHGLERVKTIEPRQRMTINPAVEGDPRLENAALSTVVQSDVPIVSERSMYWPGEALPFGEGHNSAGVVTTGTHWGLAEGRVGGPQQFQTVCTARESGGGGGAGDGQLSARKPHTASREDLYGTGNEPLQHRSREGARTFERVVRCAD